MAMKARPPDQLLDPKEAAALKMLFESCYDYINLAAEFYGIKFTQLASRAEQDEPLRKIARAKWPIYGRQFLNNREPRPDKPEGPWALRKFGPPEGRKRKPAPMRERAIQG